MAKEKIEAPSWTFDPARDIQAVEQFGYIDLVAANATSSVPATIECEDSQFNGIEEPAAIAGRPRDGFEHAQASRVIAGYKAPAPNEERKEE